MSSPDTIKMERYFLGCDLPLPGLCARKLAEEVLQKGAKGAFPSFSGTVMVLPGSFAIREFRKELANHFPGGCLPPKLFTQGSFRNQYGGPFSPEEKRASREEALYLWTKILTSSDPKKFPHILSGMEGSNFQGYLALAKKIQEFRGELDQGGLSLKEAVDLAPGTDPERRKELLLLEESYCQLAGSCSLADPFIQRHLAADLLPRYLEGISPAELPERIIIAGIPDLSNACRKILSFWGEKVSLEIWITASPAESPLMDEWGCPIPQAWENRPLPLEEDAFAQTIFHGETVRDMVHLACAVGCRHGEFDPNKTQFIAAGREITPILTEKLREMTGGEMVYDPAGLPLSSLRISRFLGLLQELCREEGSNWEEILTHLRSSEILSFGGRITGASPNTLLKELDELLLEHLPDTLENALFFASPSWQEILQKLKEFQEIFRKSPCENLPRILSDIFHKGEFPPVDSIPFPDEYTAFLALLEELKNSHILSLLSPEPFLELLLLKAGSIMLYPPRRENSLELLGFLEIPSLPHEELLICGMNDGAIPEKVELSLFLTNSQREALGLPSNRTRWARDNFYLDFALRNRQLNGGHIRFFASRYSVNKTPIRFSPFLFQGRKESSLLALTDLLFSPGVSLDQLTAESSRESREEKQPGLFLPIPPYTPGLKGAPGIPEKENGEEAPLILSVTEIKNYIASPLRFCLSKFHAMNRKDYSVRELDALHYGTVTHKVLEFLAPYEMKGEKELRKYAAIFLRQVLEKQYGSPLPLLVETQHDLLLQRLEAACRILSENASSYRVLEMEYTLGGPPSKGGLGYIPWQGAHLKGRIDRIEISRDGKTLHLLDYKTMDKGESPENVHYRKEFKDLQLPLYKILLLEDPFFRELHKELDWENLTILCGYFSLPKNVLDTGILLWEKMDDLLPQARTLLAEIIFAIRQEMKEGIFREDPEKKVQYDNFSTIFLPDLLHTVKGCKFAF